MADITWGSLLPWKENWSWESYCLGSSSVSAPLRQCGFERGQVLSLLFPVFKMREVVEMIGPFWL